MHEMTKGNDEMPMRYPAANQSTVMPAPKFDIEFTPSFSLPREDNINHFLAFIERNLGRAQMLQVESDLDTKPDYVHWADIAAMYVHIHWVK